MASRRSADLPALLAALARALAEAGFPYMLIGGQAVLVHGRPRLTEDIDLTLGAAPDRLADLVAVCDSLGLVPLPPHFERFVRETFVLPCRDSATGMRVDFIFSTTPYERQAIDRAVRVQVGGEAVRVAAAEDLILHKLFAGRARDVEDAESVVRRKGRELDWAYLSRWATEFSRVPGREALPEQLARLKAQPG
ncbi:MAG: nucleotidyl transferase AbiEii/AbiGii toxin family protein [Gemmatimonadales bacterium]